MKKIIAVLLAAVMLFALAACGGDPATKGNATDGNSEQPAGDNTAVDYDAISDTMTSADGKYQIAFITDVGQLKDKSFNVTSNAVSGGVYEFGKVKGVATAYGTTNSPGGKTLVGELGTELVVSDGHYYLVGEQGAEFVDLKKGDIVFNHLDTEKILSGMSGARGTALADGNAAAGTDNPTQIKGGGVLSNLKGNVGLKVDVTVDDTSLEEKLKKTLDKMSDEIDRIIGDYEHNIFLMEKNDVHYKEIVDTYKKMQEDVHRQANEYRALGLSDNSDYIQSLQKQWWEYNDAIKEVIAEQYEEFRDAQENTISLNQRWLDNAIADGDHSAVKQYTDAIVSHYKKLQESVHEQAEYYRSLGYEETSNEISELSDLWWEYRDNIIEAASSAYQELLDNAHNSLDKIQDLYSTLTDAAQEYAETGYLRD